jgi:hypothetical protein
MIAAALQSHFCLFRIRIGQGPPALTPMQVYVAVQHAHPESVSCSASGFAPGISSFSMVHDADGRGEARP